MERKCHMKYTFVDPETKAQKTVTIPEEYLRKNKANLHLTTQEAILMYLSDEGIITNKVVEELTAKAKENKVGVGAERKKRKAPKRKEDPIKRAVIADLFDFLSEGNVDEDLVFDNKVENVNVMNPERIIGFTIGTDKYELTLTKKRPPKKD